jgi:hypothetical protein
MSDQLLPLPLTEHSVHLCVDMQRIFSVGFRVIVVRRGLQFL